MRSRICYFAYPENLLLAMLGHEDKAVGAKSVNIIKKIRYAEEGNQEWELEPVREFYLPRCIFAETSCTGNT